jgi:uncharacterized protein YbjT (DUF2867 family)
MFVIAGVSGNTGSIVADTLLARGKEVRVVVRDASKGEPWKAKGAEVVLGTLDSEAALRKAFAGASGAYVLSPPDLKSQNFLAQRRATFDAIASAVEAERVPHVVLLSSIGAQHAEGTGTILTVHYAEERLAKTGAKLTAVRAGFFVENWGATLGAAAGGTLPTFVAADHALPHVTTRDIGLAAAKALIEGPPAAAVDVIELASGPRDLSPRDVANILGELLGRHVEPEEAPTSAVVPTYTGFGVSAPVASLLQEMYEGVASGKVAWERQGTRLVRGSTDPKSVLAALVARR